MRRTHKNNGSRTGAAGLVCAMLMGLSVCAAGGQHASAAVPAGAAVEAQLVRQSTHTVWQGSDAIVTGSIAPGTRLRVHAVLNQACKIGHFTNATCRPQSLLGWETITEDGTFSPVPAPAAPFGVCQGDTVLVVKGHTHVVGEQLFPCFTFNPST
jgi:hypothetical protein